MSEDIVTRLQAFLDGASERCTFADVRNAVATIAALRAEVERIREHLGCTERDSHTDPLEVIKMIQGWEADAQERCERLEKHLANVLEIARTWQPDYATKMDRDTLDLAAVAIAQTKERAEPKD